MPESLRILAGDCTVTDEDSDETRQKRRKMLTIAKPDNCGKLLVGQPSRYRTEPPSLLPTSRDPVMQAEPLCPLPGNYTGRP